MNIGLGELALAASEARVHPEAHRQARRQTPAEAATATSAPAAAAEAAAPHHSARSTDTMGCE